MEYQSPGFAAVNAMDDFLAKQAAQQHQQQEMALRTQQEARAIQQQQITNQHAQDALQLQRDKVSVKAREAQDAQTVKDYNAQEIGDIPPEAKMREYQRLNLPMKFAPTPVAPAFPPSSAIPNTGDPATAPMDAPDAIPQPAAGSWLGTQKQKDDLVKRNDLHDVMAQIQNVEPNTPEARSLGLRLAVLQGRAPTAAELNPPKPPAAPKPELQGRYNKQGDIEVWDDSDGKPGWKPYSPGMGPIAQMEKKDTPTGADGHNQAYENHLDSTRNTKLQEINTKTKGIEDMATTLGKLNLSLDQDNSMGDSVVAEQVVKLMAGGAGSGVRMNNALVDQVLKKTNTKKEQLNLWLKQWQSAPEGSLILSPEQRVAVRALAQAGRKMINDKMTKITKARSIIDGAKDTRTMYDTPTALFNDLFTTQEEDDSTKTNSNTPDLNARAAAALKRTK